MPNTLMLLPGLMCDEAVWEDQIKGLSDLCECRVPDYGLTDSLPGMAEIVLAMAPEQFAMAGHSMGGRVAMEVMRLAPERVTHLALLDTAVDPLPSGAAAEAEKTKRYNWLEMARQKGTRAMGADWVQGMVHPSRLSDEHLINAILDMIERKTADHFAAQINALLNRPDARPLLAEIQCPSATLCGRQDSWNSLADHEQIASEIPNAQVYAIEDAGHMATMEQPQQVTDALRDWLSM